MTVLDELAAGVGSLRGAAAADRLCELCVERFPVDAAALTVVLDGENAGTLGANNAAARRYDELEFTLGEGPCLSSVVDRAPVLVSDLTDGAGSRWPAYTSAMLDLGGVRAVYAVPVVSAGQYVGALGLFRSDPGPLTSVQGHGVLAAAVLAQLPLLDLLADGLSVAPDRFDSSGVRQLNTLNRIEVSRATGMLVSQLNLSPAHALSRLRAHAYTTGRSITEVARDVLGRRLRLEP